MFSKKNKKKNTWITKYAPNLFTLKNFEEAKFGANFSQC
jgi:hypothetical protein